MGLDMYLYKRSYVKNWSHQPDEEKHRVSIERGGMPRAAIIEARHELEKATVAEAKYKQLRILKVLQKIQGQAQPKTSDSEVLRKLLARLKNGQKLAHDRHDHTEAGVYALIIGQVEALLAETKGSSKEEP